MALPVCLGKGTAVSLSSGMSVSRFWFALSRVSAIVCSLGATLGRLWLFVCADNYMAEREQKLSVYSTQCRHDIFYYCDLLTIASSMQLASTSQKENTGSDCIGQYVIGIRGRETSPPEGMSKKSNG